MRKTLLALAIVAGSLGALAGSLANAQAADAAPPSYQYYKKAPDVFTWTGYYVEANVGYAFGDVNFSGPASFSVEPRGVTGGIGVGYDQQFGSWVLGAVTDVNVTGIERTFGIAPGIGVSADIDYFGTVRAKLGYSFGTWMVYGTGGYAWGHLASNISGLGLNADDFVNGWAYGVGAEFALSKNLSLGAEWLRLDFSRANLNYGPGTLAANSEIDLAKAVLRYRFGG